MVLTDMKGNVLVLGPKLGIMIYRFSELHDVGAYSVTTYIEGTILRGHYRFGLFRSEPALLKGLLASGISHIEPLSLKIGITVSMAS